MDGFIFRLYFQRILSNVKSVITDFFIHFFQGKLSLLTGSKDVDQLLKDIQMPDDQEIVGITERLVEQEPVTAATVSLSEQPVETITNGMQSVQTLDKVQWVYLTNVQSKVTSLFFFRNQYLKSWPKFLGTLDKMSTGDP